MADKALVVSTEGYDIDPAVAAGVVPNAAMAYLASRPPDTLAGGQLILAGNASGEWGRALTAHQRMESRALNGRVVLTPNPAG